MPLVSCTSSVKASGAGGVDFNQLQPVRARNAPARSGSVALQTVGVDDVAARGRSVAGGGTSAGTASEDAKVTSGRKR